MAPSKKKDKGKQLEWLQCSLCQKLITQQDAEVHAASCDGDHGYVQDKVLHGKVINAESILGEDGIALTKSIRDKDNAVWLAVQTMQVCGLSIGQPCVINNVVIKSSWPNKSVPLSSVALSPASRGELGLNKDDNVIVQRYHPDSALVVTSATLRLREEDPLFKSEEFCSFTAGYLDGRLITEGSPLVLRYFGQTCQCVVESMIYGMMPVASPSDKLYSPSNTCDTSITSITPNRTMSSIKSPPSATIDTPSFSTPLKFNSNTLQSTPGNSGDGNAWKSASTIEDMKQDITDSMASLDISADTSSPSNICFGTTTPRRSNYPNLMTPVKGGEGQSIMSSTSPVFARVSSLTTVLTIEGPASQVSTEDANGVEKLKVSLNDVGGLDEQIKELKSRILRALKPGCTTRCLLLHGPPGTGKSMMVKALTSHLGFSTMTLAGSDIWSSLFGEAESKLNKMFKTAQTKAPCVIVVDDIDVICPKRNQNSSGQQEHRIVGTFLKLVDEVCSKRNAGEPVVVLGVTNNRDGLDPALRRAGRFGSEIEVGVPTAPQRTQILHKLLKQVPHSLTESDINNLAANAHGYVGADLAALVNEASMHVVQSSRADGDDEVHGTVTPIRLQDMHYAGIHVKPSALREIQLEVPQVRWSDIGGMSEVKMRLCEAVELPLSHPDVFSNLGIEPPRGLLMYGPPGCSKTMVARALATECKLNFLAVKGPELFNQYVGESEKAIREVFRKARSAAPSVVFFDEIDAIAAKRGSSSGGSGVDDRVLTQLLTEMDGLEFLKDVFIMAATNRPDKIDNALLRPGRFDSLVHVPLPDEETRREILRQKFTKMAVAQDVDLVNLVRETDGYSGAEVVQVCQEAALCSLRENIDTTCVEERHFNVALQKVRPQVNPELLQIYDKFSQSSTK